MQEEKTIEKKVQEKPMTQKEVLAQAINTLSETVSGLSQRMVYIEEKMHEKKAEAKPLPGEVMQEESAFPIPMEYRRIVQDTLNQNFGIKIDSFSDKPAFMFTVIVPEEYSPLTTKEKEIIKADLRSKVISYADGANGVQEWVKLIYSSFNPEVQAKITGERISFI